MPAAAQSGRTHWQFKRPCHNEVCSWTAVPRHMRSIISHDCYATVTLCKFNVLAFICMTWGVNLTIQRSTASAHSVGGVNNDRANVINIWTNQFQLLNQLFSGFMIIKSQYVMHKVPMLLTSSSLWCVLCGSAPFPKTALWAHSGRGLWYWSCRDIVQEDRVITQ